MSLYKFRDVRARVYYLPTEDGGRSNPIFSGYRPHLNCDGHWSAMHELIGVESVAPGEWANVYLTFICPSALIGKLKVGREYSLFEGSRVVGLALITEILELQKHASDLPVQNTR